MDRLTRKFFISELHFGNRHDRKATLVLKPAGVHSLQLSEINVVVETENGRWPEIDLSLMLIDRCVTCYIYPVTKDSGHARNAGNQFWITEIGCAKRWDTRSLDKTDLRSKECFYATFARVRFDQMQQHHGRESEITVGLTVEEYAMLNLPEHIVDFYHIDLRLSDA